MDDRRYWFRWITGHQASFVLWRLLAAEMNDWQTHQFDFESDREGELRIAHWEALIDGYSLMMLYAGSCTRATYGRLIRPSMRLQHPSFSGSWAPDYPGVRRLFHDRHASNPLWPKRIVQAVDLVQRVHIDVAKRLVPDGESLLRTSPVKRQDWGDTGFLYDCYFLTRRGPIELQEVVAQLLRRLAAILDDLTIYGLYVEPEQESDDASVRNLETGIQDILNGLGDTLVNGSSSGDDNTKIVLNSKETRDNGRAFT